MSSGGLYCLFLANVIHTLQGYFTGARAIGRPYSSEAFHENVATWIHLNLTIQLQKKSAHLCSI